MESSRKTLWYPEGISLVWSLCLPALLGLLSAMVIGSFRIELRSPLKPYYDVLSGLSLMLVIAGPIATTIAAIVLVRQARSHHLTGLTVVFAWAAIVASVLLSILSFLLIWTIIQ
jgi:hypothetical protein